MDIHVFEYRCVCVYTDISEQQVDASHTGTEYVFIYVYLYILCISHIGVIKVRGQNIYLYLCMFITREGIRHRA